MRFSERDSASPRPQEFDLADKPGFSRRAVFFFACEDRALFQSGFIGPTSPE